MAMQQVFLSYSRDDAEKAGEVERALEAAGHGVWRDTGEIEGGDLWREQIVAALRTAQVMVVLISEASATSRPVRTELTLASEYDLRIVPVLLEPVEIPESWAFQLAGIHLVDLDQGELTDVVDAVGRIETEVHAEAETLTMPLLDTPREVAEPQPSEPTPTTIPATAWELTRRTASRWTRPAAAAVVVGAVLGAAILATLNDDSSQPGPGGVANDPDQTAATENTAATGAGGASTVASEPGSEPCAPFAQVPCSEVVASLPVTLDWAGVAGGIADRSGVGTGFTALLTPPEGQPELVPDRIAVGDGNLTLTTGDGTAILEHNTLQNPIVIGHSHATPIRVTATLVDLPEFVGHNQHAGIWIGVDQDNYVKLNVVGASTQTVLQALSERDGLVVDDVQMRDVEMPPGSAVLMVLDYDAETGRTVAQAGVGATVDEASRGLTTFAEFVVDGAVRRGVGLSGDSVVFSGVFASHRTAPDPLEVVFTGFSVTVP